MSTNDKPAEGKEISQSPLAPEQIGELLIEYLHSNQPLTAAIRAHLTGGQACVEQRLQPTPLPHTGKYTEVVYWLEAEEAAGHYWYKDHNCNRTAMCAELSKKFNWDVNENSLRKALQRHQKSN